MHLTYVCIIYFYNAFNGIADAGAAITSLFSVPEASFAERFVFLTAYAACIASVISWIAFWASSTNIVYLLAHGKYMDGQQMGRHGHGKEDRRHSWKQQGESIWMRSPRPPHMHVRHSLHTRVFAFVRLYTHILR